MIGRVLNRLLRFLFLFFINILYAERDTRLTNGHFRTHVVPASPPIHKCIGDKPNLNLLDHLLTKAKN